jgi:hypothetical protein
MHAVARAGFLAKAALYAVVGVYALRAALGIRGGRTIDVKEALAAIVRGEHGDAAVSLLSAGIAGLGLWFVVEALANPYRQPRSRFAAVARVGQALGGVGYLALGAVGLRIAVGEGAGPSGDEIARAFASRVLDQPTGPWAAGIVGVVIAAVGARQVLHGVGGAALATVAVSRTSALFRRAARRLAALGFAVQGTLFACVGLFLVEAAFAGDPGEATGTGGALAALAAQPYGATLLLAAAVGLLAYALFAGIEGATKRLPRRTRARVRPECPSS